MDVRLSPEQQALRDSVAQVVERLAPRAVAQLDDAERVAKLDAAVAASGWRELRAPDGDQGRAPLASGVEVAIVAEQLGRGLVDAPFTGPTLAAELRRLVGASPGSSGVETVVLSPALDDIARVVDGVLVDGSIAVDAAGAVTGLALGADGATVVEVALGPPAIEVDLTRPTARPLPAAAVTAVDGQDRPLDPDAVATWTALGLASTSADLVGTMQGAVDLACEYAAARQQYGAHIGSFQAVQHLLADAFVATEGSRSVTRHAAWAVDALPAREALAAAAVAKAYVARAARTVCETAIQVHGGIGNTWECLAHVHLRRALLSSDILGGAGTSLQRVLDHQGLDHQGLDPHGLGDGHGLR
jgi:alkylation response protein AidB-like acyl-CoA dehydrogenase